MFHYRTRLQIIGFLLAILVIAGFSTAEAVSIQDRRGEKLLLKLDGAKAEKGEKYLVLDAAGKRRALLEISQFKEDEAIAHIIKGKLTEEFSSYTLQSVTDLRAARAANEGSNLSKPALPTDLTPKKKKLNIRGRVGGLLGVSENTMNVKLTGASSLNMKGSSFALEGFYEGSINSSFQVLARVGAQTLKASGTLASASCGGSSDCSLDITYLTTEGLVKYLVGSKTYAPWVGGGVGLLLALSKSSNVVDAEKIGFTQKIILSGGAQYPLANQAFIPVQIEYDLFPNSATVTISQIFLRVGYGVKF